MRIGIFSGDANVATLLETARLAEADGFDSFWLPHIFGVDALCAHTLIASQVPRIELGTAVVPSYPRHPVALAQQALTVSAVSGGRLTLGVGLSHQIVIEAMYGYSFSKPARHMREYLTALVPLCQGENVSFAGETLTARAQVMVEGAPPVPVMVAALGPAMLQIAAELTAGTVTWMTGPRTLGEHTVPTIRSAAAAAGTGDMRVVGALPVAVTDDLESARERAARVFEVYGSLPSYRAMLDREGVDGPADVAIIGSEAEVRAGIERMRSAGVTDFVAVEFLTDEPAATATREVLKSFL
ncbi:MAG: TIGR03564 family F420-dependent LLM class oxidoreductase [Acidimicrobiales bacterium]|nr:TIGR03564 family F420-dependent LLM class oxidoreductase [Acidimicrobiales bacterium]HRW39270.1 TIGR03564 family F420-dependent LLM class oxidoreductase [Aquihabitans sp.]